MTRSFAAFLLLTGLLVGPAASAQTTAPAAPAFGTTGTSVSTIRLGFDASDSPGRYLLAFPALGGAAYLPGQALLNGQPLADPLIGPQGTLYWLLEPGTLRTGEKAELRFRLSHTAPLPALPTVTLLRASAAGWVRQSGTFDPSDYQAAKPLPTPAVAENPGAIKWPLDGAQVRGADQIRVVVEVPVGSTLVPSVNGRPVPDTNLGETAPGTEEQTERRTYYAVPIRSGTNIIRLGDEQTTVHYAGATTRYEIEPLSLIADGVHPLRLRIRALDAAGLPTEQPFVTVTSSTEPRLPDARPAEQGYQLALRGGVGVLELQPQTTPVTLKLQLLLGSEQLPAHTFNVTPGGDGVGVGTLSVTAGFGDEQTVNVQARAYYEGPLGGGKLYVAADRQGLPRSEDVNQRNTTFGDSSQQTVPLQGSDPVAFVYEHPQFRVAYEFGALPLRAVPTPAALTALSGTTRGPVRVSGFAALLPGDLVREQRLTLEGTRLLRLGVTDLVPDSETLTVLVLDRVTGQEVSRRNLTRNVDYTLDSQSGVVTLAGAMSRVDADLNTVEVLASYRLNGTGERTFAYGAQVEAGNEAARLGVAAVQLDNVTTFGVAGRYATTASVSPVSTATPASTAAPAGVTSEVEGRALLAGGLHAEGRARVTWGRNNVTVQAYHQDAAYAGLGRLDDGTRLNAEVNATVTSRVTAQARAEFAATAASQRSQFSVQGLYTFKPFVLGVGARYVRGDREGLSLTGSAGYDNGHISALLTHSQPVSGGLTPVTDFKVSVPLSRAVKLSLTDRFDWTASHLAVLSLESAVGRTNYAVTYELPSASGSGNRPRFGVGTSFTLNERTGLGVRGAYVHEVATGTGQLSASADLSYRAPGYVATLGSDLSYSAAPGNTGLTTVVRAGVNGDLSPRLNVSADSTLQFGVQAGRKLNVGYAYRAAEVSSLGYLRYQDGSLAGSAPRLQGGVSAEYRRPVFSVRGGVDARMLLTDPASLTYQPWLGLTATVTPRIRVGAYGRALIQPATDTTVSGYGVEAGFQPLPGVWLNAGYNLKGFSGIDTAGLYSRPGAYVRLDLTLDETLNGARK